MDLHRGMLARIDRKVVSGLGTDESYRTVRVPVSEALWSTWKRYCDAAGISMGRAIVDLIGNELHAVIAESIDSNEPVLAGLVEERLVSREEQIVARERAVTEAEERLSEWAKRLRTREGELQTLEQRLRASAALGTRPREPGSKVGRNERCPCKSGLKYKHCHGLAGWQGGSLPDNG